MEKSSDAPSPGKPRIAAILPAFNEESYIGTMVLKTRRHVDEVFVVDDGSTDGTAEVAEMAGATVIRHDSNRGYGASIQSLLAEVRKKDFGIVVLLDADWQHDPDEIPELIQPIAEGYDIVIGSREQQKTNIPRYRRGGQKIIGYFSKVLSGEDLTDSESGFRVFSRKAIDKLDLRENGMAISAETISRASESGLKITERPISIRYTPDGSTLNPLAHGFQVLRRIIFMISERRPLLFFGLSGAVSILAGIAFGIRAFGIVIGGGGAVSGYTLVAILLLFIGVLSAFTGIILNVLITRRR